MPSDLNVIRQFESDSLSHPSLPIPRGLDAEPMVVVRIAGQLVPIPQHILSDATTHLRLATEAHVGIQDCAKVVELVLSVLANRGTIAVLS